jgi:hypothetical protein
VSHTRKNAQNLGPLIVLRRAHLEGMQRRAEAVKGARSQSSRTDTRVLPVRVAAELHPPLSHPRLFDELKIRVHFRSMPGSPRQTYPRCCGPVSRPAARHWPRAPAPAGRLARGALGSLKAVFDPEAQTRRELQHCDVRPPTSEFDPGQFRFLKILYKYDLMVVS